MVTLLEAAPGPEATRAFAKRHPDKWVEATAMLADLADCSPP
jgi:hypothetical protein